MNITQKAKDRQTTLFVCVHFM